MGKSPPEESTKGKLYRKVGGMQSGLRAAGFGPWRPWLSVCRSLQPERKQVPPRLRRCSCGARLFEWLCRGRKLFCGKPVLQTPCHLWPRPRAGREERSADASCCCGFGRCEFRFDERASTQKNG